MCLSRDHPGRAQPGAGSSVAAAWVTKTQLLPSPACLLEMTTKVRDVFNLIFIGTQLRVQFPRVSFPSVNNLNKGKGFRRASPRLWEPKTIFEGLLQLQYPWSAVWGGGNCALLTIFTGTETPATGAVGGAYLCSVNILNVFASARFANSKSARIFYRDNAWTNSVVPIFIQTCLNVRSSIVNYSNLSFSANISQTISVFFTEAQYIVLQKLKYLS